MENSADNNQAKKLLFKEKKKRICTEWHRIEKWRWKKVRGLEKSAKR